MKIADFFFTEQEMADYLGVNRLTVWRWIRAGKIDAQSIGGVVLIPKWEAELLKGSRRYKLKAPATTK